MIALDDFQKLLREVEELEAKKNRAEGKLAGVLERLRKEEGCDSLEEAEEMLKAVGEKERKLARKFTAAKQEFEKRLRKGAGSVQSE